MPLALLAAERGRLTERFISRISEVFLALPLLILLLAVVGVIGNKLYVVMAIVGLLISAGVYRIMLGVAQSVRQRLYVDAARVNGLGSVRVNLLHVLPSMATVVAVQAAQLFGIGLLIVAGLAFLGFGPAEPEPSWGFMIQDASSYIFQQPWLMVPTGVVLALTVIAANELADAIAGRASAEKRVRRRRRRAAAPVVPDAAPAEPDAILDVRGLTVSVDDGPALVTDVSFSLRQGRVLGLVGESGCGKTMTARSLMGLLPPGVSVSGGSIRWQGRELVGLSESELIALRGREIALISQEPMVALDPMFSVAYQLTQPIRRFRKVGRGEARKIAAELLQPGRHRRRRARAEELPAPAVRWHGAARLHRPGAHRPAEAADRRRADHRPRRDRAGRDPQPAAGAGPRHRPVGHHRQPRPRRGRRHLRRRPGHVRRRRSSRTAPPPGCSTTRRTRTRWRCWARTRTSPEGEPVPLRLASIPGTVPPPGSWPTGCRFATRCQFAQEKCTTPFPALPAHGDGSVLCIRVDEIHDAGITWGAEHVGAEIAPDAGLIAEPIADEPADEPAPTAGVIR